MEVLINKVALITGGASGIGRATALLFAQEGAAVAIADINQEMGESAQVEIKNLGGQVIFIPCDVSKASDCKKAVEQTVATLGGLDILFNNAGIVSRTNLLTITETVWDHVMDVNVKSVFLMSKFAIPYMEKRGEGTIINVSSGWGIQGGGNAISYCASKGAVTNMTRAMAIDHGAQNIRVNAVCPGDTDTPMLQSEAAGLGIAYDQLVEDSSKGRPLRRIGTPMDIAQAVLFLASDASAFVTGSILVVDGGGLAGTG